ncbi:MAG: hypothetical protein IJ015_00075 [Ruminococcus sp.]|nr:hypothetical protein [Ruminococcus sp.]
MKFLTKLTPFILVLTIFLSMGTTAFAAETQLAGTSAKSDVSLLAADFDVVGTKLESEEELPSSFSSKELGLTTPVRNQLYNTCWAYGAMATFESVLLKKGITTSQFSPMHLNHWGTLREDGTGWNRNYTGGGYSYIALGYLSSWQGPLLESDYPENTAQSDFATLTNTATKQAVANGIIYLDTGDIETVKTAIYEYGAVVGNYHVNDAYYNYQNHAYYCNHEGLQTPQLNGHAISIVGWDDNFPKENFNESARPSENGAWLCKNSWGENWGDNGYYWISYEDYYIFDTRFGHSYTYNDFELYDETKTLYQNEIDGATYEFEYISNYDTLTYINVFDIDKDFSTIDRVNFETVSQGAMYNIYSIPMKSDGTINHDINKWKTLYSGVIPYAGYHSIDVEDFKVSGDKFAIGIELTNHNNSGNSIGVSEWLTSGGKKIFTPQSKPGQSYLFYGSGNLIDVMDFYKERLADEIGGTFVIKAVAKETEYTIGDVDLDGIVAIIDATLVQMSIAQKETLTEKQMDLADLDRDGAVSIMDATIIQQKLAGIYKDPDDNSSSGEDFGDFEDF